MAFTIIQQLKLSNYNYASIFTLPRRSNRVGNGRLLSFPRNVPVIHMELLEEGNTSEITKLKEIKHKLQLVGINCDASCIPGRYNRLYCPKCSGGQSVERSLSLHIIQNGDFAMWRCFRADCGWAGRLIAYFAERMISEATLRRNSVMQLSGDQVVIAFPYKKDGVLVGCKYRTVEKKYWQERGTEKWLYGLDDINEAAEIIIVEGEIDKLAMEEAGFRNCISVPCGAPSKVSARELPPWEKDTGYQYLWNCKEYLDKVSRVILATDGDQPGQALAEELARRLGKDRCWRVRWPKKDDFVFLNDANEVLKSLGTVALKEVIENAELYQLNVSSQAA
ncbi:hypothetical protein EZV62_027503 [Acer yangbiense]|uniref:Toprim domain-containing protein n=1 Tax=Acer yangbiense TaxID=1000413 RepID=A0A5C7GUN6_9ROSI|nr:hypothetical protein EZV62_027503 [Acer yangbiense]